MTPEVSPENCLTCGHHEVKRKNHICNYKKCNMGDRVYYPETIPEDHKTNLGMVVCQWIPKKR